MGSRIEGRLSRLEQAAACEEQGPWIALFEGETEEEAMQRTGNMNPGGFILRVIVDPPARALRVSASGSIASPSGSAPAEMGANC
jgi:hypothetical protein